jgi:hypothetical protein
MPPAFQEYVLVLDSDMLLRRPFLVEDMVRPPCVCVRCVPFSRLAQQALW